MDIASTQSAAIESVTANIKPNQSKVTERNAVRLPRPYLARIVALGFPADGHNHRFPVRVLPASRSPYAFSRDLHEWPFSTPRPAVPEGVPNEKSAFEEFLVRNATTSLLVIRDGVLEYERYFQGRHPQNPVGAFSATKSIMSLLIGLALEDGVLASVDEPILADIPELCPNGFVGVTFRHLLNMTGGFDYVHGGSPWAGGARAYYDANRIAMLFRYARTKYAPDTRWLYTDYGPMLEGIALSRRLGMSLSQYAAQRLFEPLGMPHQAEWLLDHEGNGFEHAAGGFYASPLTLAALGEMARNDGRIANRQIIPADWMAASTTIRPDDGLASQYVQSLDFHAEQMHYKHHWWIWAKDGLPYDFTAIGLHGQYVYVSPRNQTVVVRTGTSWGKFGSTRWLDLMHDIAHSVPA